MKGAAGVAGRILFLFLLALVLPARAGAASSPAELVREGIGAYRKGEYRKALDSFRAAFARGYRDGRLEYDLGNCWWRLGDKAKALVHYERARAWMPRDPDVLANIRLCRKALGVDRSATVPFLHSLWAVLTAFTPAEHMALAAAFSVLCFLALGLHTVFRKPWLLKAGLGAGVLLLLSLWLGLARPGSRREAALVTVPEASLVSEPREGLSPLAALAAGAEVRVLGRGGEWVRVEVEGRKGWLPAKDLGFLDWRMPPFAE